MNGIPKNIMWSSQEYRSNFSSFFTTEDGCELMKYLAIYFKTCNRNNDQKGALSHINGFVLDASSLSNWCRLGAPLTESTLSPLSLPCSWKNSYLLFTYLLRSSSGFCFVFFCVVYLHIEILYTNICVKHRTESERINFRGWTIGYNWSNNW